MKQWEVEWTGVKQGRGGWVGGWIGEMGQASWRFSGRVVGGKIGDIGQH